MADTQPGRDANGNVDPNHWAGKHVATSGREADLSQGKAVPRGHRAPPVKGGQQNNKSGRHKR